MLNIFRPVTPLLGPMIVLTSEVTTCQLRAWIELHVALGFLRFLQINETFKDLFEINYTEQYWVTAFTGGFSWIYAFLTSHATSSALTNCDGAAKSSVVIGTIWISLCRDVRE